MRITVLVKQVPETSGVQMDPDTGTLVRKGDTAIVNPLDIYGIETALRLKERYGAETCALSMGPPAAESALREALAMGIDRAALATDRAFAGSDTWATANILAGAVRALPEADLIICGERATDGDTGQVGPELAAALDLPVATYVRKVVALDSGSITVERSTEHGLTTLKLRLPALITVLKETGEPRLPTLDGKIRARSAELVKLTQAELKLDGDRIGLNGSPTRVVKIFHPQVGRTCRMFPAERESQLAEATGALCAFLRERGFIGGGQA